MAAKETGIDAIAIPFNISVDWMSPPLSTHCEFVCDGDWIESKDQGGGDYRLLQISNIGVGCFVETGNFRSISEDTFKRLNCTEILEGDVLVARMPDPTGRAWYVDKLPWCSITAVDVAIIRTKPKELDAQFLSYFLNSPQCLALVHGLTTGTTRLRIRRADIERLCIPYPPLSEQRAIAHILGTLDDKIGLNRRMNETLEAIARALFKSWFVDFDPVRAKAEGRSTGLPKHIADLFPDSFEDSELGKIPKGWTTLPLYSTATFINGAAYKSEDFCNLDEGIPVIKIAELKEGISAQTRHSQRIMDISQRIDTGDLLYSWSGSPDTSLDAFLWASGPGLLNQHIFKVVVPDKSQKRIVYYLLKYLRPVLVEIARNKQTTGLGHVTVADLKRLLVCWPSSSILSAFDWQVASIFDRAFDNILESRTLATLRDTLLPKLISGELRIGDAKKLSIEVN